MLRRALVGAFRKIRNIFRAPANEGNDLSARLSQAKEWADRGELSQSLRAYSSLLRLYPNSAEVHYRRGNVLARLGQLNEALEDYDHAIGLTPDFGYAWCNRGVVLERMSRLA